MKELLFLVFVGILFSLTTASADSGWMSRVEDCNRFRDGLNKYYKSLGKLDQEEKKELSAVLYEACDGKFSRCNFSACRNRKTSNSFAWLDRKLSCEQFVAEVKARYAQKGSYSTLESKVKADLHHVLDISCSERFKECNFPNCKKEVIVSKESDRQDDAKLWEERLREQRIREVKERYQKAMAEYDQIYSQKASEQRERIKKRLAEEEERELAWDRFMMPDLLIRKPLKKPPTPPPQFQGVPTTPAVAKPGAIPGTPPLPTPSFLPRNPPQ